MKTDSLRRLGLLLGFTLGFYVLAVISQPIFYLHRFGSFSHVAGVDVSYLTESAAKAKIEQAYASYADSKIVLDGETVTAGDYIASIDAAQTVGEAMLHEQRGYFAFSKLSSHRHSLVLTPNDAAIAKVLLPAYDKYSKVPVDANIIPGKETKVIPEQLGQRLLLVESKEQVVSELSNMSTDIELRVVPQLPALSSAEAASVATDATALVAEPIMILGDGTKYEIKAADLASWLKISSLKPKTLLAIDTYLPQVDGYVFLDPNKVFLYVDKLAGGIDTAPVNAKLTVTAGKVVVAAPERIGRTIDRRDAIQQVQLAVTGDRTATLKIASVKPEIRADNLAELGLVELIATGASDFTGSPVNRTHNVKVGASKFDGVLMKPGEDVSFNKILGPVDASTGYLPELVILADKTVPEYGGGLCQVSSTAFRAALNASLPILERHAHAYPVSYYRPYGVDATIYLPTPDLRWQNDTGKYVLVQTRIEGKKLYFDFYGTKKPVKVTFSGNAEATGAVEVVEKVTPTLTDQGARGANSFTAVFYRHIYDASGKLLDNDKFTSKYDSPDKYPH